MFIPTLFTRRAATEIEQQMRDTTDMPFNLYMTDGTNGWAATCNTLYQMTSEPYILCCGDDVLFHDGWLEALHAAGTPVVAPNDLGDHPLHGVLAQHPFMSRLYVQLYGVVDRPDAIFHPYPHEFPDNEFTMCALARNMLSYQPAAILEHLHPAWGKANIDETYLLGLSKSKESERIFEERQHVIRTTLAQQGTPWRGWKYYLERKEQLIADGRNT